MQYIVIVHPHTPQTQTYFNSYCHGHMGVYLHRWNLCCLDTDTEYRIRYVSDTWIHHSSKTLTRTYKKNTDMGIRLIYFSIIIIIYELQAKSSYLASFNLKLTNFEAIYITHYLIQKVKKMKNQEYLHKRSYLDA